MSEIAYNFGQIEALVGQMHANKAKLDAQMETLKGHINTLYASWDSEAQQNQKIAQDKWNQAHEEAVQLLNTLSQRTSEGNDAMRGTNSQIASSWM